MRPGTDNTILETISAPSITTALCARLDFQSETIFLWTGLHPITPTGSGDTSLDGHTFDPLAHGVVVDIGENTFSYTGSSELTIHLNIPSDPDIAIAAAQTYPAEYQARPATIWRALKIDTGNPLAEPVWLFRRIRTGSLDKLEVQADGQMHKLILTIESHQGRVSNASNQTYLDQRKFDPNDASQDYAVACANGDPAPSTPASNYPAWAKGIIREMGLD